MEVKPVHLHLLLQIRPAIEQQGQKAFLDMSSCLPPLPEHLWAEATVCGACQRSMKSTRALTSHCSRPSQRIQTSRSEHGCPSSSQPALHTRQPLERSTFQTGKHSTSASSALIRQHCGEFCGGRGTDYREKFLMPLQGVSTATSH